ncbi:NAD(P)H-hydrate dehydratase [Tropicimonas sp. S265A]|uniref:NAD(P)H-hydrate dehydratase n=1 Tax=Tropicimonas sp. S265A TaxID=3415134 RepID=UPI003C7B0CA1
MTDLLTAAQMRALETSAMESGQVTGLELMERAGRGVLAAILSEWPDLQAAPHKAVVLCGPGNNGGDGFVVARLLKEWGWWVDVLLYGNPANLPPDAKRNHDLWSQLGPVGDVLADLKGPTPWQDADLAVDALFGTGLTRPLEDLTEVLTILADAAERFDRPAARLSSAAASPRVVAIDIPSGLDADSGKVLEPSHGGLGAAAANLTVSFHSRKLGHVLSRGPSLCSKTVVADIGLDRDAPREARKIPAAARLVQPPAPALLHKRSDQHKYDNGHAVILSGPPGAGGAARLAARAALRIGAGLVSVACEAAAVAEHAARLDAVMIKRLNDAADLGALLSDERLNALCLGPGLGVSRARDLVAAACKAATARQLVLDADALTAFADAPDDLFAILHSACVLTPHAGEFARLFPDIAAQLKAAATQGPAYSKVDAARAAATRAGCVVLLKGPDTVIAAPSGKAVVNAAVYERAAPWLATAGAGDVLSGLICGLLARGLSPFEAAQTAAWVHSEAARGFGPGLIAEDLPEAVPAVLSALGSA